MKLKGVKYHHDTKEFEAYIGKRSLGMFKTEQEARDKFDEEATKLFAFPFLNKKALDYKDEEDL